MEVSMAAVFIVFALMIGMLVIIALFNGQLSQQGKVIDLKQKRIDVLLEENFALRGELAEEKTFNERSS